MQGENIGAWTAADLRRFIVNEVLSEPGVVPPAPVGTKQLPTTQQMPPPISADGDVPVWDAASQRWVAARNYTKGNAAKVLRQNGAWGEPQLSYIRVQGVLTGFIADLNFRIYNFNGAATTIMSNDPFSRFSFNGSTLTVAAGSYIFGLYVIGNAAGYECGWCLTYNGGTIDSTIQNGSNWGGLGAVQNMGVSATTMTNFFSSSGTVQISGFQNLGPPGAVGIWAVALP